MGARLTAAIAAVVALAASVPGTAAEAGFAPGAHAPGAVASPRLVANGSWTTYHGNNARTGYDASAPAIVNVAPTAGWTMPALDGDVYASPLVSNGVVYAATLNGTVYALNQSDGSVLWSKNLGTPQTGGWQCGNIGSTGILGTPVIDAAHNRLYAVSEVSVSGAGVYHLFGLDLANNGNVVLDVTLTTPGFDWTVEQERGALAYINGYVYVPFGGRAGDCGAYHGYVFAVNVNAGTLVSTPYITPGVGMGYWSGGGVVVDDTTGNVFATSGNATTYPPPGQPGSTDYCTANGNGTPKYENDAVVRLAPISLAHQDSFVPQDWQSNWCGNDQDLGSISPVLISPSLLFQTGKWGAGFLLDPNHLGGTDGQAFPTPSPQPYSEADTCGGNHSDATFGSQAYAAPYLYVECEGQGIAALSVNTGSPVSFTPAWAAGGSTTFGPPIVAGGAVWAADWSNGTGLYAFNQTTGALIYHSSGFGIDRFVTPAEAGGQVLVPSINVIRSFTFTGTVSVTPSHFDFGGQAPSTTSAAQTATFHNNTPGTVNVTTAAITGANSGSYVKGTDTCTGQAIPTMGSCTVQVSFNPSRYGGLPATLTFTDSGLGSPHSIPLNGEGALDDSAHLYTLDGYGGLHSDNGAPAMNPGTYWANFDIARSAALFPDGTGGYVLDGYGGLHPFGSAPAATGNPYWRGFDIARQVVMAPWSSAATPAGWVLDGYGGVHPFNGAPAVSGYPYFGFDIARGVAILPDSTAGGVAGYVLDGYGGVHGFGGAPAIGNAPYWAGWDIARGITVSPNASRNNGAAWVVDGYGGIHAVGTAPVLAGSQYFGFDIARGIVAWTGAGPAAGGWVLEGYGGLHPFGSAPTLSAYPYWPNFDIANSLGGNAVSSGSRRRT